MVKIGLMGLMGLIGPMGLMGLISFREFEFAEVAPEGPAEGDDQRHGDAHGNDFAEHDRPASFHLQGCEEGEIPGELAVQDMVHDEHDRAAPEHQFQAAEVTTDERVVVRCAFAVSRGGQRLSERYDKTSHMLFS